MIFPQNVRIKYNVRFMLFLPFIDFFFFFFFFFFNSAPYQNLWTVVLFVLCIRGTVLFQRNILVRTF